MKRIIEHVRNKPAENQNRIILTCAIVMIAVLIMAWIIVGNGAPEKSDSNFFQSFSKTFNETKEQFKDIQK